jgi:hypothetical protein
MRALRTLPVTVIIKAAVKAVVVKVAEMRAAIMGVAMMIHLI